MSLATAHLREIIVVSANLLSWPSALSCCVQFSHDASVNVNVAAAPAKRHSCSRALSVA